MTAGPRSRTDRLATSLRWLRSGLWWIPLLFAVLTGSVGFYAYDALERSTHAQLRRELETALAVDRGSEGDRAGRGRNAGAARRVVVMREAHRLYTEMGATGHAERVATELT